MRKENSNQTVTDIVCSIITYSITSKPTPNSQNVEDQVYASVVDIVPPGCLAEDIALAASVLYGVLRSTNHAIEDYEYVQQKNTVK